MACCLEANVSSDQLLAHPDPLRCVPARESGGHNGGGRRSGGWLLSRRLLAGLRHGEQGCESAQSRDHHFRRPGARRSGDDDDDGDTRRQGGWGVPGSKRGRAGTQGLSTGRASGQGSTTDRPLCLMEARPPYAPAKRLRRRGLRYRGGKATAKSPWAAGHYAWQRRGDRRHVRRVTRLVRPTTPTGAARRPWPRRHPARAGRWGNTADCRALAH